MKNTLENKAKFFALYWGQLVLRSERHGKEFVRGYFNPSQSNIDGVVQGCNYHLELTPLSDITDEDAVKLGYGNPSHLRANLYHNIDELRGLGYAIPWMGLSVEKLIEYGWVKLKTLNK